MKFSVGDKVQCVGVLHNGVFATSGLVGAIGEVFASYDTTSGVVFDVSTTKDKRASLWGNPRTKRLICNDELILLPEEEQPSFEEELLKLFGGE